MTIKNIITTFTSFCLFCISDVIHVHGSPELSHMLQPSVKRSVHNGNKEQPYYLPNKYSNIYDLLSPTSDFVFYHIFGVEKRKSVLISLLNSILKGNPRVKDVRIDPTEHKRTTIDGKTIVLDIKATIDDGTIVNIEMQCINTGDIYHRSIYYQSLILRDYTIIQSNT